MIIIIININYYYYLCALYIAPHGKRKPGRHPTNFLKYIQELLGERNDMLLAVQMAQMACDRTAGEELWSTALTQPKDDDDDDDDDNDDDDDFSAFFR